MRQNETLINHFKQNRRTDDLTISAYSTTLDIPIPEKMKTQKEYHSLKEFYPFYLSEHQDSACRTLHFVGTGLVILSFVYFLISLNWIYLALVPVLGYGFAWVGHFFFEKNKPATFQYPGYSLASDFIMFWDLLRGKESFNPKKGS